MSTFAKRARERREELNLKQDQVALLSGLKQADISKIENGKIQKTVGILMLARALQCSPYWLAYDEGEKIPMVQIADSLHELIEQLAVVLAQVPEQDRDAACGKALQAFSGFLPKTHIQASAAPKLLAPPKKPVD